MKRDMSACVLEPAARMAGLRSYQRQTQRRPIDLRLDANEGYGPDAGLLEAARGDFAQIARTYPDTSALETRLADRAGVPRECVLATAGADDALERLCRVMVEPGRRALMTRPTFEMLGRFVRGAGGVVDHVPWMEGPFPAREMADAVRAETSLVFVVSPNNPTGGVATLEDLRRLRSAAPRALLVLDHAYVEFADEDLTRAALEMPGVAVTRTLSKAWGLAGLRVGYLIADPEVVRWARSAGLPYAVSGLSAALAVRHLTEGEPSLHRHSHRVRQEVKELTALLTNAGARPLPSQANFVMARFHDAKLVADLLAGAGISVRSFPDQPDLEDALRIGCPGEASAFERLTRALRAALRPQAVVLDLRGGMRALAEQLTPELVRGWAAQHRVGVMMDCPMRDAETVLVRRGVREYVEIVVGAEDAAVGSIPALAGVALQRLRAQDAWMLVGTAEGVTMSRSAGAIPVGVSADGVAFDRAEDMLLEAGAARVLPTLTHLTEILP